MQVNYKNTEKSSPSQILSNRTLLGGLPNRISPETASYVASYFKTSQVALAWGSYNQGLYLNSKGSEPQFCEKKI